MSDDKLPALPPRPETCNEVVIDYMDSCVKRMDTQDARIATLVAEAEISDERVTEYRDANRGLGKRITELEARQAQLIDNATQNIAELEREIREARELLTHAPDFRDPFDGSKWTIRSNNWCKRNAERTNGK